jgi:hypothetical protein
MVICPWCGVNYPSFISSCEKCGGPIPYQAENHPAEENEPAYPPPPEAPRPISSNFAWKLMMTDGLAIAGFVLAMIGGIFTIVGLGLSIAIITAFIGIPFALMGIFTLIGGGIMLYIAYQQKSEVVKVLTWGKTTLGQITSVEENLSVRVNNRNPWVIEYQYQVNGQTYPGKVSTLHTPAAPYQPQKQVYVLYLPDAPAKNALYPHP